MQTIDNKLFDGINNQLNQSHRVHHKSLFLYRIVCMVYMTFAIMQASYFNNSFLNHFLYLTIWGALFTYAYFTLVCIENISFTLYGGQFYHDNLWKLTHILYVIAFCLEVPIFLMFWSYVYPNIEIETTNGWILNISLHVVTSIMIVMEIFINDIRFVWSQIYVLITLSIAYLLTNMIYVLGTGVEIYPGINWKNAISYILCLVTVLVVIGVFSLGLLYYDKVKKPILMSKTLLG